MKSTAFTGRLAAFAVLVLGLFAVLVVAAPTVARATDVPHDLSMPSLSNGCVTCHATHTPDNNTCGGACPVGQHPNATGTCTADQTCPGTCNTAGGATCTVVNGIANCQCPPSMTGANCTACATGFTASGSGCIPNTQMTCTVVGAACWTNLGTCQLSGACGADCPVGQHNRITDGACVADETCSGSPCGAGTCSIVGGLRVCSCSLAYTQGTCASCAPGYTGYPTCVLAACTVAGTSCANGHGTCTNLSADCNVDSCAGHHDQASSACMVDEGNTCGPNAIYTNVDGVASCQCPPNWKDDGVGGFCNVCADGYGPTGVCTTLLTTTCNVTGDACAGGVGRCTVTPGAASEQVAQSDGAFTVASGSMTRIAATSPPYNGGQAYTSVNSNSSALTINVATQAASASFKVWIAAGYMDRTGQTTFPTLKVTVDSNTAVTISMPATLSSAAWYLVGTYTLAAATHTILFSCPDKNSEICAVDGVIVTTDTALTPTYASGSFAQGANWDLATLDFYSTGTATKSCNCSASTAYNADCITCKSGYHLENGTCMVNTAGACIGQTCSLHGTCFVKKSSKGTTAVAVCNCDGEYYDNPANGSDPLSCDTCTKVGGLQCTPSAGYTGTDLELCSSGYTKQGSACVFGSDACSGVTCDGRGTCGLTSLGAALCDCSTRYYGSTNTKCDLCASPSMSCGCKPGYTGAYCNDCATGYHREGGKCVADGSGVCMPTPCAGLAYGTCYATSSSSILAPTAVCACKEHFYGADCRSCTGAPVVQPYLINNPSGQNALCLGCHSSAGPGGEVDTHWSSTTAGGDYNFTKLCTDCHDPHTQPTAVEIPWTNAGGTRSFLRKNIRTSSSTTRTIVLVNSTDWADGDATYDGICEVCHTLTNHHQGDAVGGDHTHGPQGSNCLGCHPHNNTSVNNTGFQNSGSGGDCIGCHGGPQPSSASTSRRNAVADFSMAGSHHIQRDLVAKPLSKYDCVICHLEGDDKGATTTYHNTDPAVNLRDVDNAANTAWVWQDPDTIDNRPAAVIGGTRQTQTQYMTMFCLRCHDSNGIGDSTFLTALKAADTALGASRSATIPFADATTVLNVNTQFDPSGNATHSIYQWWNGTAWANGYRAPYPNKGATTPRIQATAWVNSWDETRTTNCSDCHQPGNLGAAQPYSSNAHGAASNNFLLGTMTGTDAGVVVTSSGRTSTVVCFRCHTVGVYTADDAGSRYTQHGRTGDHNSEEYNCMGAVVFAGSAACPTPGKTGMGCLNCHGGEAPGSIHGNKKNTIGSATPAYQFLSGAALDWWVPPTVNCGAQKTPSNWNLGCNDHSGGGKSYTRKY